jgi:uncharacterized protein (TIGR03437 family)
MRSVIVLLLISAGLYAAPALSWSAYFGNAGGDRSNNPAIDQDGNIWITGRTGGNHPTTTDAFQPKFGGGTCGIFDPRVPMQYPCGDLFITKLDPTGQKILFSTYLGGSNEDYGKQIAADRSGNIYVMGTSQSTDFPTIPGDTGTGPVRNFLLKMTTAGKPVWLMRLSTDTVSFAVDPGGSVYLAGTASNDAYVSKIAPDGVTPVWTYRFGGSDTDSANLLCVDKSGAVYTAGTTRSTDFPVTPGALEPTLSPYVMFAAKIKPDGSGLGYATYFSGGITAVACDDNGGAYLAGVAVAGFRTTTGAAQAHYADDGTTLPGNAFLAKLNSTGSGLAYSTYIGGAKYDIATGVAVDGSGIATVVGLTNSLDFPASAAIQSAIRGAADGFATRVSADGSTFLYSTFLGGTGGDLATGVAVDSSGNALVRGCGGADNCLQAPNGTLATGDSLGAPATDNGVFSQAGIRGVFLASIAANGTAAPRLYQNGLSNLGTGMTAPAVPGGIVRLVGYALGPATPVPLQVASGRLTTTLSGTSVQFDGIPAPLLMVSADSIHAVVPFEVAGKQQTQVTVQTAAGRTNAITFRVSDADPAFLSADGVHVAALNEDGSVNSPSNPAVRGSIVALFTVGSGQTLPPESDGVVVGPPLPATLLSVSVAINASACDVQYAGAAPGLVAGVTQINIRIPSTVPPGDALIRLTVGSHSTLSGPVISLR